MTTISDLEKYLATIAPWDLQLSFDNSGFLIGNPSSEVENVLLSLDITDDVVQEAIDCKAQCIVSHHPILFHPVSTLVETPENRKILRMIEHHIAAICLHTNLDIADGGVNDVLLSLFSAEKQDFLDNDHCGRIGILPEPLPLYAFLSQCKSVLQTNGLRYYDAGNPVLRIAVMGGSGGSAVRDAFEKGCDTYLTSDIKYHDFILASELGINLIDGDHYCTENPIMYVLEEKLTAAFPSVSFSIAKSHKQLISFYPA